MLLRGLVKNKRLSHGPSFSQIDHATAVTIGSTLRRRLGCNCSVLFNRFVEGSFGLVAFLLGDAGAADTPELLDRSRTPQCAAPRRADRLAADDHVHRVGVHLREVPQRHPTLRSIGTSKVTSCALSSAGTSFVAATLPLTTSSTLRVVPRGVFRPGACRAAFSRERHLRLSLRPSRLSSFTSPTGRRCSFDAKFQRVGVAVGDVRSSLGDAVAPLGEVDFVDLAELHVDAALADAAAGDAREVGLAADLQREAAVHDVVPAVPFRHAVGVHRADEVAHAHARS